MTFRMVEERVFVVVDLLLDRVPRRSGDERAIDEICRQPRLKAFL